MSDCRCDHPAGEAFLNVAREVADLLEAAGYRVVSFVETQS